jgi:hypothetical protein
LLISNLDWWCLDDDLLCFFSGDDGSAHLLEDVLQCALDPKPCLLEFGNGKRTCSSSECSLPEENVSGDTRVSLDDSSSNAEFNTMKEPHAKFVVPEKSTREYKNTFEPPSALGMVVVLSVIYLLSTE